jgi:hypothetical protein
MLDPLEHVTLFVQGSVWADAMLDTGANLSCVSAGMLESLLLLDKGIQVQTLQACENIELADGRTTSITRRVCCDLTLGRSDGITLMGVFLYVLEDCNKTILVGNDILKLLLRISTRERIQRANGVIHACSVPEYTSWLRGTDGNAAAAALSARLCHRKVTVVRWEARRQLRVLRKQDVPSQLTEVQLQALLRPFLPAEFLAPEQANDLLPGYELDPPAEQSVEERLLELVDQSAKKFGWDENQLDMVTKIVMGRVKAFGNKMDIAHAAKVEPMRTQLRNGAIPFRARLRQYTSAQRAFLSETLEDMLAKGLVKKTNNARWAAPVMVVDKPGKPGEFRMVVDLRYVNHWTIPIQYPMPDVDATLHTAAGEEYFFSGDLLKGFWQVEVSPDSRHLFSFMTPDGVFEPTRLPMGATDSPLYFQAVISEVFQDLIKRGKLHLWIDDVLLHAKSFEEFCAILVEFLDTCVRTGLVLNIDKTVLAADVVQWNGRRISGRGVQLEPRAIGKFRDMAEPTLAGELGEFLQSLNWMKSSLLRFQEKSQPLWDIFNKAKATLHRFHQGVKDTAASQKRKNYATVKLANVGWGPLESQAFASVKSMLDEALTLAHFDAMDTTLTTCLFTDASKTHYAALLTQVREWDPSLPVEDQDHEPLGTFNGEFKAAKLNWSVIEKEAYPIIESLIQWPDQLRAAKGVRIYTDHANIVSLFRPEALALSKTATDKVYRWLHGLSAVRMLTLEHLPGLRNRWADMLSRWAHPTYYEALSSHKKQVKVVRKRKSESIEKKGSKFVNQYLTLAAESVAVGSALPSVAMIRAAQENLTDLDRVYLQSHSATIKFNEDKRLWMYKGDRMWIPSSAEEVIVRLLVAAHCGNAGHRPAQEVTVDLKAYVWWPTLVEDVQAFVTSCLSCERSSDHKIIPRPWGYSVSATRPGEIVHFDYLFIGSASKTVENVQYLLVLKDNYSGFVELIPTATCDHRPVVEALQWWSARFGAPSRLVSDQGSHFKNTVLAELVRLNPSLSHHFTLAYTPWSNGSVERVNRDILRVFKKLLKECKLKCFEWPALVPQVMSGINGMKSRRLSGYSPRQVFLRRVEEPGVLDVLFREGKPITNVPLDPTQFEKDLMEIASAFERFHREELTPAKDKIAARNRKAMRISLDFCVGEFVLRAAPRRLKHKLDAIWTGPFMVTTILNDWLVEIRHLVSGEVQVCHSSRLKFYCDADLDVSCRLKDSISEDDSRNLGYEVEALRDILWDKVSGKWYAEVLWQGFDSVEGTFELLEHIYEDVPEMVLMLLDRLPKDRVVLIRKALNLV